PAHHFADPVAGCHATEPLAPPAVGGSLRSCSKRRRCRGRALQDVVTRLGALAFSTGDWPGRRGALWDSGSRARPGRRGAGAAQGYRAVPRTADLRIEAWAESRDECVAEALRGLIASFADISDVQPARVLEPPMPAGSAADFLASAADE